MSNPEKAAKVAEYSLEQVFEPGELFQSISSLSSLCSAKKGDFFESTFFKVY